VFSGPTLPIGPEARASRRAPAPRRVPLAETRTAATRSAV